MSYVVILSPSLVMLSGAKHLSSSAQSKLREESMLLILKQCEMLRAVYPEREMKGILPPVHCIGVRMTSEEPALSEANRAQHDRIDFFSNLPKCPD